MSFRVVLTDPHQHSIEEKLLVRLAEAGASFEARRCADEEETVGFCRDADAVMTSCTQITPRVIEALTRCRLIQRIGTGYDNVDDAAAGRYGIPVANVPNFCTEEVANHVFALLLACDRKIAAHDRELRRGKWNQLEELLSSADFVSLHIALTPHTHPMIGPGELQLMKREAILINTARGGVVNETELVEAVRAGTIAGAGLDVFAEEPLPNDSPLIDLENVVLSPHTAAHSVEAMAEVRRRAVDEVIRVLRGEPLLHVVNGVIIEKSCYLIGLS